MADTELKAKILNFIEDVYPTEAEIEIDWEKGFACALDAIKKICKAESEGREMAKCDYCQHVEMCGWRESLEEKGCDFFDDGNKWIPVSERLPEENKAVIASTEYGVYPEARYTKEYGWEWAYESGADYWEELEEVKAWMPLPETYKPESGEK